MATTARARGACARARRGDGAGGTRTSTFARRDDDASAIVTSHRIIVERMRGAPPGDVGAGARDDDDANDGAVVDASAMVEEARRRAAALLAGAVVNQPPAGLDDGAARDGDGDGDAGRTVWVPPPPPLSSPAPPAWRAQPQWRDASEIQLEGDDVGASTSSAWRVGDAYASAASRDAENHRARAMVSVGCIPELVRRANSGVLGVYAPIEPRATAPDVRPRAYIEARFARFERDLSGYDAGTSARKIMETRILPRPNAPSLAATNTPANANAEPIQSGYDAAARPGLGSRITDDSRAGDEYAKFRAHRSYRSRTR